MANFNGKFESEKQEWETPMDLFAPLNDEFCFDIDVCATDSDKKCSRYYSPEDNGLKQEWRGNCWMNPPYKDVGRWVKKAYQESQKGATVVCLIPSRTNTAWWHEYVMKGEIRFIRGRPKFGNAKHGLPQPLSIVVFRKAE